MHTVRLRIITYCYVPANTTEGHGNGILKLADSVLLVSDINDFLSHQRSMSTIVSVTYKCDIYKLKQNKYL